MAVLIQAHCPDFDSRFIDGDDELEARYGHRMPVMRDETTGTELDWPFSPNTLAHWPPARKTP